MATWGTTLSLPGGRFLSGDPGRLKPVLQRAGFCLPKGRVTEAESRAAGTQMNRFCRARLLPSCVGARVSCTGSRRGRHRGGRRATTTSDLLTDIAFSAAKLHSHQQLAGADVSLPTPWCWWEGV